MSATATATITSYTSSKTKTTYKTARSGDLSITHTSYEGRGPRNMRGKRHCVAVNIHSGLNRDCIATLITDDAEKARQFANQVWKLRQRRLQVWDGTARAAIDPIFRAASR